MMSGNNIRLMRENIKPTASSIEYFEYIIAVINIKQKM